MSDPTPQLNLKPRRAASARSAAQAYGATQAQAAPAAPLPAASLPPGAVPPAAGKSRGFLASNWPLMTAAAALLAGGVVMGMAVGSSGPKLRPATAVAAVAPLAPAQQAATQTAAPAAAAPVAVAAAAPTLQTVPGSGFRLPVPQPQSDRPALAPPPPPAMPLPPVPAAPAPAAVSAPAPAAEPPPQLAAAPPPPPSATAQNTAPDRGTPQAWRARAVATPAGAQPPFVAILIDDAGLDRHNTARAIALPGPVTLSFMTYANDLAEQSAAARKAGHELMLHLPMEPLDLKHNNPGPNALLMSLDAAELQRRLVWGLARFDGYVGVNNHMGSRFTRDAGRMAQVMDELKKHQVFWLDSLSGPGSVGSDQARKAGLDAVDRDIFLDDDRSPGIAYELAAMERIAKARGDVIAIGHPHTATMNALEKWVAGAKARGFSLVPVSTVLLRRQQMER
ncbi:divergent polysaccharide deacetylase family protein [Ferrovibrio sp.]|uniref:divergent polysaccharide deacetylase family protein n=1 Tax=Ferrovibrio sp. TaxID=1917215 RepID=UPI0035131443